MDLKRIIKIAEVIVISILIISVGRFSQAASFTIDNLNLREAVASNPPASYFKIGLEGAWNTINSKINITLFPVTIGIVDTGIERLHPEFNNVKFGNTPPDALVDAGEFINKELKSHGTNVTGIIGANNISANSPSNYILPHMNGVVSGVKNLDYTVENRKVSIGSAGLITLFSTVKNITKLSESGAQITNLSISGSFNPLSEVVFTASFLRHSNILFVVSAGNNNKSALLSAPGNLSFLGNVVTVGATDTITDQRAIDSNFGSSVNIVAPGDLVFSPTFFSPPLNLGDYEFFSGTSASAPLVTGVAAILKALEPEYQKYHPGLVMTPEKIKDVLMKSADPIKTDKPLGSGCFDPNNNPQGYNGCRLNAHRAVAWLLPPTPVILNNPVVVPAQ